MGLWAILRFFKLLYKVSMKFSMINYTVILFTMPSKHFLDYKTSLAQKALLDYTLKNAQISSKFHEMTFLQPKQSMNSLLGVKIAQNPYFWFGYNSSKWRKITHWTCFSTTPNKSSWECLYPVKNWSPKNSFSKRKNLRESIESNFYKLVNLIAKDLPVCTIFQKTQPVKKLLSMLSQVFSLRKWVFGDHFLSG